MITKDKPSCDCLPACTTLHYTASVRSTAFIAKPHKPNPMEIQPFEKYVPVIYLIQNETTSEAEGKKLFTYCIFASYNVRNISSTISREGFYNGVFFFFF